MRDKVGEHEDRMDSIFQRLLILEERISILHKRLGWLEDPDNAPKPKTVKKKEPEGKL